MHITICDIIQVLWLVYAHVSKLSVPYYGISKNPTGFFKAHMHLYMSNLSIPSQMYYGTSKNPTEFCKLHMHVHVSKLSVPSQMYYGTLKNPMGFCKVGTHAVLACTHVHGCPSTPKCTSQQCLMYKN